jgi:hypothetical protein
LLSLDAANPQGGGAESYVTAPTQSVSAVTLQSLFGGAAEGGLVTLGSSEELHQTLLGAAQVTGTSSANNMNRNAAPTSTAPAKKGCCC